jgi:hypothetical protein
LATKHGLELAVDHADVRWWALFTTGELQVTLSKVGVGGPAFVAYGLGDFRLGLERAAVGVNLRAVLSRSLHVRQVELVGLDLSSVLLPRPQPPEVAQEAESAPVPLLFKDQLRESLQVAKQSIESLPLSLKLDGFTVRGANLRLLTDDPKVSASTDAGVAQTGWRFQMKEGFEVQAEVQRLQPTLSLALTGDPKLKWSLTRVHGANAAEKVDAATESQVVSGQVDQARLGLSLAWHKEPRGSVARLKMEPLALNIRDVDLSNGQGAHDSPLSESLVGALALELAQPWVVTVPDTESGDGVRLGLPMVRVATDVNFGEKTFLKAEVVPSDLAGAQNQRASLKTLVEVDTNGLLLAMERGQKALGTLEQVGMWRQALEPLKGRHLAAGLTVASGRQWLEDVLAQSASEASSSAFVSNWTAARPEVAFWASLDGHRSAEAVHESLEAKGLKRGPADKGSVDLRLAFFAFVDDLILEARWRAALGGLDHKHALGWGVGQILSQGLFRWKLRAPRDGPLGDPKGTAPPQAPSSWGLGVPIDVPLVPAHVVAKTPLGPWASRPLESLEVQATTRVRELHLPPLGSSSLPASNRVAIRSLESDLDLVLAQDGSIKTRKAVLDVTVQPNRTTSRSLPGSAAALRVSMGVDLDLGRQLNQGSLSGQVSVSTVGQGLVTWFDASTMGRQSGHQRGIGFEGQIAAPFRVVARQREGRLERLNLESRPVFRGATFIVHGPEQPLVIRGISGEVPVHQQVLVASGESAAHPWTLAWDPVLDENPFRRGGSSLGGPYSQARNIVMQHLEMSGLVFGPLAASLAVHQNQLVLDRMDGEFLSGELSGQCFVNVAPGGLIIDFNGRASGLDGARLLGIKGLARRDSEVSGRVAFNYDVQGSLVSGRIDVARIPARLLDQLLIKLDPAGTDSAVGAARLALGVAVPGRLALEMGEGLANLDIEIVTKGVGTRSVRIPSLPLTRLLEDRTVPLRRTLEATSPEPRVP